MIDAPNHGVIFCSPDPLNYAQTPEGGSSTSPQSASIAGAAEIDFTDQCRYAAWSAFDQSTRLVSDSSSRTGRARTITSPVEARSRRPLGTATDRTRVELVGIAARVSVIPGEVAHRRIGCGRWRDGH
jgi:hypothetical protein